VFLPNLGFCLLAPYFDHDALMHHVLHVLYAPEWIRYQGRVPKSRPHDRIGSLTLKTVLIIGVTRDIEPRDNLV